VDPAPPSARRVVVLGQRASLDVDAAARRSAAEGSRLVLLSLGDPVSAQQRGVIDEAIHLASELRIWLDAELTPTADDVARALGPAEPATFDVSSRERARLRRALGATTPRDHDAGRRRSSGTVASEQPSGATGENQEHAAAPGEIVPATEPHAHSESVEALAGREVAEPIIGTMLSFEDAMARKEGPLRVYLGAAPGVGKTYAMLGEGRRRKERGTDVVVGVVHTYGRPATIEMLEGLEILPPRTIPYRGRDFGEMDVEALIARAPEVALIDELAHTNVPGSRRAKRWEDVVDVLAAGIEVITTVNAQHLASLNDVVANVTGIRQQETVPDWLLDLADQVELVDMSPHALRRRMLHGNIYPESRKAETALQRFFTTENLTALRELALMRVANQVDEDLLRRWSKEGIPETRERILVCVSRPSVSDALIRRGSRIAQRTRGDLLVIHVVEGKEPPGTEWNEQTSRLVRELGGEFEIVEADDAVETVLSYAYQQRVTQIVVGESLRSKWKELVGGSFVNRLIRAAKNIDVHVMARKER
jgi:nucleotide-binding universal stress UspA family protein